MNSLLLYLAPASACLLVFYGFYHLVLRKETCFQYNRAYLLLTPVLAFLLPLVPLPGWLSGLFFSSPASQAGTVMVETGYSGQILYETRQVPVAGPFNWQLVIWALYVLGFFFFALRLIRQLWTIRQYIRQHQDGITYKDGIQLVPTQGQSPAFSFLNYLFYDNSQPVTEAEWQQIWQHESVHIAQKHTWDILYLELLSLIFWFNPVLYGYKKALAGTHEFIADAAVTRTVDQKAYAALLVKQVFRQMDLSLGHYFNKSLTLKRMNMLQRNHLRPNRLKQALVLPLAALLFVLVSAKNPPAAGEMEEPTSTNTEHPGNNRPASADPVPTPPQERNKKAVFPGGKAALKQYLAENLKYPAEALKTKMTGQAIIQVTIDEQGRPGNFKTLQADHPYFEQEAIRVLKDMPAWQPASSNGKAQSYTLAFPFIFGLESNKGIPALILPAGKNKFALQDATIVVGYSQVIPGKTVTQSSAAPSQDTKPATQYPRDSKIFTFVEQMAAFPGGEQEMNNFIRENLKYPAEAKKNQVEGLVVAQFVVDRNGKISDPTIVKSLGAGTDEEVLRLVKSFPDFMPAKQNGKPVEFRYTLPVRFGIPEKTPAKGFVPPAQNNPPGKGMIRLLKESESMTDCQPRLFRESQINTNKGQEKHLVKFHYRNPEGCPGETYQVEALRYSHMRGKRVIGWEGETTGNSIDLVNLLKNAQPGDELYVTAKGKSAPGNGKAAVPFNAGIIIPLK